MLNTRFNNTLLCYKHDSANFSTLSCLVNLIQIRRYLLPEPEDLQEISSIHIYPIVFYYVQYLLVSKINYKYIV